jgi:hypothetical protein
MGKTKRRRIKRCSRCSQARDVLFRVRLDEAGDWTFVCTACLSEVKPDNPHYQYGGTWKSRKRH